MGNTRTSNKDIADRLDTLIDLLTKQAMPANEAAIPVLPVKAEPENNVDVDEAYLQHITAKAQGKADEVGEQYVVYARRNKAKQIKLAYALLSRFDSVSKQPSCIGAIAEITPS